MSVLNDRSVIDLLSEKFVNTWILGKDLKRLAAETKDEQLANLYARIKEAYTYPVDSIVISPDGTVIGEMSSLDAMRKRAPGYLAMLNAALRAD